MTNLPRLLLLAALVAPCFLTGCSDAGPAGAVKAFYRNVEVGEVDAAVDLVSDEFVSVLGRKKMKAWLIQQSRDISEKGGIKSVDILYEDVHGTVADVGMRVVYGNGDAEEHDIQLTKIDGQWKLTPEK